MDFCRPAFAHTAVIEERRSMEEVKFAQRGTADESRRSLAPIAVLHIPHASRQVPAEERLAIRLDDAALDRELLRMTDAYTDELFPVTAVEAGRVIFPLSRLVCDVERFPSDDDEPMAARGMGVSYVSTSMGGVLRVPPQAADRQILMDRWYWPHHATLERLANDVAARSGVCLIVDCHSFASTALPYELDQASHRADICIGTDPFHTPAMIRDAIVPAAAEQGYSVAVDAPFSGALVPPSAYRKDRRILSVMIEVNRRLYMDEHSGLKRHDFEKVRATVGSMIVIAAQAAQKQAGA
jgi:N-formylglutamate amidohydrolase